MKNRLNGKNKIMPINTLAVSLTALFLCKTLRKGIENGGGGETFGGPFSKKVPFFHKKVPFLANIERCSKFLEYVLHGAGIVKLAKR